MSKFYAVAKGKQVGIFSQWSNARTLTEGCKQAIHKSFPNMTGAVRFMKDHGITIDNIEVDKRYECKAPSKKNKSPIKAKDKKTEIPVKTDCRDNNEEETDLKRIWVSDEHSCQVCKGKDSSEMFACSSCEAWVHFECTQLPAYYVLFLDLTEEYPYRCQVCVKKDDKENKLEQIDQGLKNRKSQTEASVCNDDGVETITNRLNAFEAVMTAQRVENEQLKNHVSKCIQMIENIEPKLNKCIKDNKIENKEVREKEEELRRVLITKSKVEDNVISLNMTLIEKEREIKSMEDKIKAVEMEKRKVDELAHDRGEVIKKENVRLESKITELMTIIKEKGIAINRLEDRLTNVKDLYEGGDWSEVNSRTVRNEKKKIDKSDTTTEENPVQDKSKEDESKEEGLLFVHDSIGKYVDISRWARDLGFNEENVEQKAVYTLDELKKYTSRNLKNYTMVIHIGINDIKQSASIDVVSKEWTEFLNKVECRSVVMSLPCPTQDMRINREIYKFKTELHACFSAHVKVKLVDNNNLGDPNGVLLRRCIERNNDATHINRFDGTSILASNIKARLRYIRGIPAPVKRPSAMYDRQENVQHQSRGPDYPRRPDNQRDREQHRPDNQRDREQHRGYEPARRNTDTDKMDLLINLLRGALQ